MCGRYTLSSGGRALADQFDLASVPEIAPRYNIAPSQEVPVVVLDADRAERVLRRMRWGLIPHWARDPAMGDRMINARSETAAGKPAFRDSFQGRRCLLPADGFFEWKRMGARKQPIFLRMLSGQAFAFAGLWDRWRAREGKPLESCTLLTTEPNDLVASLHDRMPVILPPEAYAPWLDPALREPAQLLAWLRPYPAAEMIAYPVSRRVNDPAHDDPGCIEPLDDPESGFGSLLD